jgi:hypothetical protein
MEAVRTSETSVNFNVTIRHIPEDSNLNVRSRDNLKSHTKKDIVGDSIQYKIRMQRACTL